MKVALVVPQSSFAHGNYSAPLNLGYIASYLRQCDPSVEIKIFDGYIGTDVEKSLVDFEPDIVGVTATTVQVLSAYRLGDWIKEKYPNVLTVFGGVHASVLPHEASEHFDVVVVGEGEKAFVNILRFFRRSYKIPKIVYGEEEENIDNLPMPAYDLFNMDCYLNLDSLSPYLKYPVATLITSRGCFFKCVFCRNSGETSRVRYYSAERIVEEILYLHEHYGVNDFFFEDDEFLINLSRLREFGELIKNREMSVWFHWGCQARATTIAVPILKLVKQMGCVLVVVGFESGCEKTLQYLKTGSVAIADNKKAVKAAHAVGMAIGGYFIVGVPGETIQDLKGTLRFIEESDLAFAAVSILTAFPGTKLWQDCIDHGIDVSKISYDAMNVSVIQRSSLANAVSQEDFSKFMVDLNRVTWIVKALHNGTRLRKLMLTKTFWYMWLFHPKIIINWVNLKMVKA